jgi:hypothetical protein
MFSQLAQQNNRQHILHRSGPEFDRSVDLLAGADIDPVPGDYLTDSYLLWWKRNHVRHLPIHLDQHARTAATTVRRVTRSADAGYGGPSDT